MPNMKCTGEKCPIPELTKGATVCTAHDCKHRTPPMPDIKEKLVELLRSAYGTSFNAPYLSEHELEPLADHLIANGVTIQEHDGCAYCKEDRDGYIGVFGAFSLLNPFHGDTWYIGTGHCKARQIYFCPMCGRKLSEPPKGE